ncbi:MAG: biotin transporter BioY [Planctomycetota bacterium]|nr:biotin transporter BioY [Planctomycetota bacterium]
MQALALSEGVLGRPIVTRVEARLAIGVASFTLLTALGAFVRIPLPFTPVPITLQTFFVLSAGVALGRGPGALSQMLYVLCGLLGAPFFEGGGSGLAHIYGPTGGYLLAFPIAAWTAGSICRGEHGVGGLRTTLALVVGAALIFTGGAVWFAFSRNISVMQALPLTVIPFLPGLIIKVAVGTGGLGMLRGRLDVLFPGRR